MNPRPEPASQTAYDARAPQYDQRWQHYLRASHQAVFSALADQPPRALLDLACGTGLVLARVAQINPATTTLGIDLSHRMLSEARARGVAWTARADAARIPCAATSFDTVVCTSAFHELPQPLLVLSEVRRVLQPGGRFVLVDWCDDYLSCKLCSLYLSIVDPAFRRAYGLEACRDMLQHAGFAVLDSQRFKIDWLWGLMRLVAEPATALPLSG